MNKKALSILMVLTTFLLTINTVFAGTGDSAGKQTPLIPAGESGSIKWFQSFSLAHDYYYSVACNGKKYVAVGFSGAIWTSSDGETWKVRQLDFYNTLRSIIWDGKRFLACGEKGTIAISPDGETWRFLYVDGLYSRANFTRVIYAKGEYVAVSPTGTFVSEDGENWDCADAGANLSCIAYDGDRFVAAGLNCTAVSQDGYSWEYSKYKDISFTDVIWNGSVFIALSGNKVMTSDDGAVWSLAKTAGNKLRSLVCNGNSILAAGYGGSILESDDGKLWNDYSIGGSGDIECVIWAEGRYVAAGSGILVSDSGLEWTEAAADGMEHIGHICWNGSKYICSGSSQAVSTDGVSWKTISGADTADQYSDIIPGKDLFIAVGSKGISVSGDGSDWTKVCNSDVPLTSVVWNGSKYISVGGSGLILSSSDGNTWTAEKSGVGSMLCDIIWDGKRFIATGRKGTIIASYDGVKWGKLPFEGDADILSIAWNGKIYVCTCSNGYVLTSPDLKSWRANLSNINYYTNVKWLNDRFLITGAGIIFSEDGYKWINSSIKTQEYINDIIWDGKRYIAAGDQGLIMIGLRKNSEAAVKSSKYTINEKTGVISNIPYNTGVGSFLKSLEPSAGAELKVYSGAHEVTTGTIAGDMKLKVISEDRQKVKTYVLNVKKSKGSVKSTPSNTERVLEVKILQDGREYDLNDPDKEIRLKRDAFTIRFNMPETGTAQIAALDNKVSFDLTDTGSYTGDIPYFSGGTGLATDGPYESMIVNNEANHYFVYSEDPDTNRVSLAGRNKDKTLLCEWKVDSASVLNLNGYSYSTYDLAYLPLDKIFVVIFVDFNNNNIIDSGEYIKTILSFNK